MSQNSSQAIGPAMQTIPARRGRATRLATGQAIKIINTHGTQVLDTWCFNADDMKEFMSMEHHRAVTQSMFPGEGDPLERAAHVRSPAAQRAASI